jgi:hypothetical protein
MLGLAWAGVEPGALADDVQKLLQSHLMKNLFMEYSSIQK